MSRYLYLISKRMLTLLHCIVCFFLSNRMDAFRETFQALQHSSIENLLAKGEYINPHGKAEVISRSLRGEI